MNVTQKEISLDRYFRNQSIPRIPGYSEDVWYAFLVEHNFEKWSDLDSKEGMHPQNGQKLAWDGYKGQRMTGKITKLVPFEDIEFEWRLVNQKDGNRWPIGHFANVSIHLTEFSEDETGFDVRVDAIPEDEEEEVRKFWNEYFIPKLVEFFKGDHEIQRE